MKIAIEPFPPQNNEHFGQFFAKTSRNIGTVQYFDEYGLDPLPSNGQFSSIFSM